MAWISVHESVDGPKLRNLYKKLGCSKFEAVGILNFLWFWGLANAEKDGLILYADKEDIERYLYGAGAGCTIPPGTLVDALIETGWIDETSDGMCIHDWEVWQEQWYKAKDKREADARRKRESRRNKPPDYKTEEMPEKRDVPQECPPDSPQEHPGGVPPDETPTPPAAPESPKYAPAFEGFWEAYPRKIGKGDAYKKYKARRNDGYSDEELLRAAKNYAHQCKKLGTQKEYIKHPKTFLSESLPFLDFLPKREQPQPSEQLPDTSNPFAEYREEP